MNISETSNERIMNSVKAIEDTLHGVTPSNQQEYVNTYRQTIFYGVPGCGKSFSIDNELKELNITKDNKEEFTKRVVFHPEFTNSDFIGQILPTLEDNIVNYKFTPGQFTKILRQAYENPQKSYALIIEEINRGNASAIFGELFQLLDRFEEGQSEGVYKTGWSSYCIMNDYINAYLRGVYDSPMTQKNEKLPWVTPNTGIRLPSNLSIFATMNTSDQNVFKLDNAFKRRWNMQLIKNRFGNTDEEREQEESLITGFKFTWGAFRDVVNKEIKNPASGNESSIFADKQLGTWFIKNKDGNIDGKAFTNKVLEYLWDDVFTDDYTIFNKEKNKSFEDIVENVELGNYEDIFLSSFLENITIYNNSESEESDENSDNGKRIPFEKIGVKQGDVLLFKNQQETKCIYNNPFSFTYDGENYKSLTAVTKKIKDIKHSPGFVSRDWYLNGESLANLQKNL